MRVVVDRKGQIAVGAICWTASEGPSLASVLIWPYFPSMSFGNVSERNSFDGHGAEIAL
jgi:hypothetical protein